MSWTNNRHRPAYSRLPVIGTREACDHWNGQESRTLLPTFRIDAAKLCTPTRLAGYRTYDLHLLSTPGAIARGGLNLPAATTATPRPLSRTPTWSCRSSHTALPSLSHLHSPCPIALAHSGERTCELGIGGCAKPQPEYDWGMRPRHWPGDTIMVRHSFTDLLDRVGEPWHSDEGPPGGAQQTILSCGSTLRLAGAIRSREGTTRARPSHSFRRERCAATGGDGWREDAPHPPDPGGSSGSSPVIAGHTRRYPKAGGHPRDAIEESLRGCRPRDRLESRGFKVVLRSR